MLFDVVAFDDDAALGFWEFFGCDADVLLPDFAEDPVDFEEPEAGDNPERLEVTVP